MPEGTKIATCCYCGTRAALVLRGRDRHELACRACGAPLHELKQLKRPASAPDRTAGHPARRRSPPRAGYAEFPRHEKPMPKYARRRKSRGRRLLSEVFDLIEDLFD